MTKMTVNLVTTVLGVLGVLFIFAGPAFNLMASNTALFLAIACFVIAGSVKTFAQQERQDKQP